MNEFDLNLPNYPAYQGIKFSAKPSNSYNEEETTERLIEFLQCLYKQLPNRIAERLKAEPRLDVWRDLLEERVLPHPGS